MKNSQGAINSYQTPVSEWLVTTPRLPRLLLGLVPCAAAALYMPIFLLALFGGWINVLTLWLTNFITIALLALVNLVGNKIGRMYLVTFIFTIAVDCYLIDFSTRVWTFWGLWHNWRNFLFVNTAVPLNAYLFTVYKKAASL